MIFSKVRFVTSVSLFAWGCPGYEKWFLIPYCPQKSWNFWLSNRRISHAKYEPFHYCYLFHAKANTKILRKSKEKFVFLFIFYQKCQRPQLKSKVKHSLTILIYKTKSHHTSMQLSITGVFGFTNLIEKQKQQKWRITKYIKVSIYLCMIWFHVSFRTIHFWQKCGT